MKANELKQKFGKSMEQLITAIESDKVTDEVKEFWHVMSHFHHYSLRNQILIAIQKPGASKVAGYKTWQKMGRQVRKGEYGISIFAPMRYLKKESDKEDDYGIAFKGVSVFDISQTDGDELPRLTDVAGSDHVAVLDRMVKFATDNGITINRYHEGIADGYAQTDKKIIGISDRADKNEAIGILAHELAHIMIDQTGKINKIREYEAELSAYLFCDRFGIEIKSPHYLKSWGAERKDLEAALKAVSKFTDELISKVAA